MKIGILGCGGIAKTKIIPALRDGEIFQITAIASKSSENLLQLSQDLNCQSYHQYDDLINDQDLDAIYLSLPPGLHFKWAEKAIRAKKHVYVEKPLATNYTDAQRLVALALEHKTALKEGYMFQYHKQNKLACKLIQEGAIGDMRSFSATFCFPPLDQNGFRYRSKLGGGSLLDAAGYPVKAASLIVGHGLNVMAATLNYQSHQVDVYGGAFLVSTDGLPCHVSFGFDNFYQCRYEVLGSTGKLVVPRAYTAGRDHEAKIELENKKGKSEISAGYSDHFKSAFSEFHSLIKSSKGRIAELEGILEQARIISRIKKEATR